MSLYKEACLRVGNTRGYTMAHIYQANQHQHTRTCYGRARENNSIF